MLERFEVRGSGGRGEVVTCYKLQLLLVLQNTSSSTVLELVVQVTTSYFDFLVLRSRTVVSYKLIV